MKKVIMVSVVAIMAATSVRADIASMTYVDQEINSKLASFNTQFGNLQQKLSSTQGGNVQTSGTGVVKSISASNGTVTVTKDVIVNADIANNTIQTAKIANNAVTASKIGNLSIGGSVISDNAGIKLSKIAFPTETNNEGSLVLTRKAKQGGGYDYQWERITRSGSGGSGSQPSVCPAYSYEDVDNMCPNMQNPTLACVYGTNGVTRCVCENGPVSNGDCPAQSMSCPSNTIYDGRCIGFDGVHRYNDQGEEVYSERCVSNGCATDPEQPEDE